MHTKNAKLLLALLFFSGCAYSNADVKVLLTQVDGEHLSVTVQNVTDSDYDFEYNFCRSSVGSLSFELKDSDGNVQPVRAFLNDGCALDEKFKIRAYGAISREFNIDDIVALYENPKGVISFKALFCGHTRYGKKTDCISSNTIDVDVSNEK
ncbi:hypothetical protein [Gallaecimonas sp. GXIMD1310]|uniref:hypothetical protein n=1 Tax=Gallaecimonas sp. GXIMD1310 TaxID=3131926 RepID=UPI003252D26D